MKVSSTIIPPHSRPKSPIGCASGVLRVATISVVHMMAITAAVRDLYVFFVLFLTKAHQMPVLQLHKHIPYVKANRNADNRTKITPIRCCHHENQVCNKRRDDTRENRKDKGDEIYSKPIAFPTTHVHMILIDFSRHGFWPGFHEGISYFLDPLKGVFLALLTPHLTPNYTPIRLKRPFIKPQGQ